MKKVKIYLMWDQFGSINHSISKFFNANENLILGISFLSFLSHQLGTYQINYGFIHVRQTLDYLINNNHNKIVINRALKSAALEFAPTKNNEIYIKYKPNHALFSNSDSLEEGSRQLVNNYHFYVRSKLTVLNQLTLDVITLAVLSHYKKTCEHLLHKRKLHSNKLWTKEMPEEMLYYSIKGLVQNFNLNWWDNEPSQKIEEGKTNFRNSLVDFSDNFASLQSQVENL